MKSFQRTRRFIARHPIGRQNPRSCWKRWLQWQVGCRVLPYPVQLPWIEGASLIVEKGMTGATGNWYCGLHEFADMALLLHFFGDSNAEGVFLDIGANVGSYTVLASKVCKARSVAFEPVPTTFQRLLRNVKANGIESLVSARQLAVGGEYGTIQFTTDQDTTNQVADDYYEGSVIEVAVTPLDQALKSVGQMPEFWKIDVEGFEREVLRGATASLDDPAVQAILLEGNDAVIEASMKSAGFTAYRYDPFGRCLTVSGDDGPVDNNLWIRDPQTIEARCRASKKFDIFGVSV